MSRLDIIKELNELDSSLANHSPGNPYSVPGGYFENFASTVIQKIYGSPFLSKENPYTVPVGYFESFPEMLMARIRNHADYLNSKEELELISPLLSSLKKEPVYSVPENYFTNFSVANRQSAVSKQPAQVIGMFSKKLYRYAAAAVITGLILVTAIIVTNRNGKAPEEKIMAKVEKDVKKINDVKQLDKLSEFMNADLNEKAVASNDKIKTDDIEKLLKDVPLDELKDFSEESKDMQDVMVTN